MSMSFVWRLAKLFVFYSFFLYAGRENLGGLVENAISGKSMGSLIRQPSGCGEQNMISMTLPVIAAAYLDRTNQWEAIGLLKRNEAIKHIETGRSEIPDAWNKLYLPSVCACKFSNVMGR